MYLFKLMLYFTCVTTQYFEIDEWSNVTIHRVTIISIKVIVLKLLARSICQNKMAQMLTEKGSLDEHMTPVIHNTGYP